MLNNSVLPISRKANIIIQEVGNELLIYDLNINKVFSLNETSALIWQSCDGKKTVSEIAEKLSIKLRSPITEEFVWLALEQLKTDRLLENSSDISIPFKDISRRDVIRRVGLSTLAALPLIIAITAPTAAQAASVCTPNDVGDVCPSPPGECCPVNNTICCSTTNNYSGGVIVSTTTECEAYDPQPNGSTCSGGCKCSSLFCNFGTCCAPGGTVTQGNVCVSVCDCVAGLDCLDDGNGTNTKTCQVT